MFGIGPSELAIIGVIAVLLFGRRLPDVAKSLGASYREFRKGLSELQSQVNINEIYSSSPPPRKSTSTSTTTKSASCGDFDDHAEATAPKFEPPPCEPQVASEPALPSAEIEKPIAER